MRAAFAEEAAGLGVALANVIALLCPEVIVLGGGLVLAGAVLLDPLREAIDRNVLRAFRGSFQVRQSELGEDAVIAGALLLAAGDLTDR